MDSEDVDLSRAIYSANGEEVSAEDFFYFNHISQEELIGWFAGSLNGELKDPSRIRNMSWTERGIRAKVANGQINEISSGVAGSKFSYWERFMRDSGWDNFRYEDGTLYLREPFEVIDVSLASSAHSRSD